MKILTVLSAALLVSATVSAQRLGGNHNEEGGAWNTGIGFKAGLNVSSAYSLTEGMESEGITGYHIGAYGKVALAGSESWAVRLEALYSRKGADFRIKGEDEIDSKLRLDYLDVPLLLSYSIVGENTWSIMAGPQASLMLTAKDTDNKEIGKEGFSTFEMGATAGVEFGYKIMRVGARYNVGLQDVLKSDDANPTDFNFKNHFGQFYVGVEF